MTDHAVVSQEEWTSARIALLEKEKEFTRLRDELSQQRRNLPWEKIDKEYLFDSSEGKCSLADLFAGRSQLIVYHFMFAPNWQQGCPACSMIADHYNAFDIHLSQRDVSLVTISSAPLEKLTAFKQRMAWDFTWVSSFENDFNTDFQVSFSPQEREQGEAYYNYSKGPIFPSSEAPGISVFCITQAGDVMHTYSSFARGLDMFLGVYHMLDIVPKGRDEEDLPHGMAWVRHHDQYDSTDDPFVQLSL